ncbi:MAG: ABC transporter permease, partial [Marivirga sp.]|nr:ABC transporter permease [Marivirga sp.]
KVLGSSRKQLINQFFFEAILISALSAVFTAIIIIVTQPYFNRIFGQEIFHQKSLEFWLVILAPIGLGTFVSGFYPALYLSSFQPIVVLKGKLVHQVKGIKLREILVVFQFTASLSLLIATATIFKQVEFMRNQNLGMDIRQKVVVKAPRIIAGNSYLNTIDYFKNELSRITSILQVTTSSEVPGKEIFWTNEFRMKVEDDNIRRLMNILVVDEDFISTYGLELTGGRNFSKDITSDMGGSVIINETALSRFGFTDPEAAINKEIIVGNSSVKKIVGVIKDFHQQSLKRVTTPIILYYIPWSNDYFTLSVRTKDIKGVITSVEKVFQKAFPDNAFEYFFLDEQFNQQYRSEEKLWNIFMLFAVLSVFVAAIGLFGLSSFIIIQRTKEIAIRRILGSSAAGIVMVLCQSFIKPILMALLFASILSAYFLHQWLQGYAYRITMPWLFYLSSGITTIAIALTTISVQAIRSAQANPIDAIKTE